MTSDRTTGDHTTSVADLLETGWIRLAEAAALDRERCTGITAESVRYDPGGLITFTETFSDGTSRDLDARLLALLDTVERRFHWGWAAPEGVVVPGAAVTLAAREFGERHGVEEFTTGTPQTFAPWSPRELCDAAVTAAGTGTIRRLTHTPDGRWHTVLVIDDPARELPAPTPESVRAALVDAIERIPTGTPHRRYVEAYGASREGLTVHADDSDVVLEFGDGDWIRVSVDREGWITDVDSGLSADDLVADAALLSAEHQLRLAEVVAGARESSFDLEAGTVTFHFTGREDLVCTAHHLGTQSDETADWMWSWAKGPGDRRGHGRSNELRAFGRRYAIPPFLRRRCAWSDHANGWFFEVAAKPALDVWTGYNRTANAEGTIRAFFLLEHPELQLGGATPESFARTLTSALEPGRPRPTDHRRALESYAVRREGVTGEWTAPDTFTLCFPDGGFARVEFTDHGIVRRLTTCERA